MNTEPLKAGDAHENDPISSIAKAMLAAQDGLDAARAEKLQTSVTLARRVRSALCGHLQQELRDLRKRYEIELERTSGLSEKVDEIKTLKERLNAVESENARLKEDNKKLIEGQREARSAAKRVMEALQSEVADNMPSDDDSLELLLPSKRRRSAGGAPAKTVVHVRS
ncbi:hypothetical protein MSAN_02503200 [Mycena sanguinolenta]|uniref:Uncharacterized protein n=1 Tax=Mycena sanguinolenta TaxID=230812 RepID=A0A8H6WR80_9AGAR|nr:hypothetical protein MSAN_02503200 [Mycena sanguinolenta]